MTWKAYDRGAARYAEAGEDDPAWRARWRERFFWELPAKRVLELGCGNGLDAEAFSRMGLDVVGLDGSLALLEAARARCPSGRFIEADLAHTEAAGNGFDGLWAMFCLFHVAPPDLGACLADWACRVRAGGPLFIGLAESPALRERTVEDWLGIEGNTCVFHYHPSEVLRRELLTAGFEDVEIAEDTPAAYRTEAYQRLGLSVYVARCRKATSNNN